MKKRAVTFYLPPEMHDRLALAARIAGTPMTAVIEHLVGEWLARHREALDEAAQVVERLRLLPPDRPPSQEPHPEPHQPAGDK